MSGLGHRAVTSSILARVVNASIHTDFLKDMLSGDKARNACHMPRFARIVFGAGLSARKLAETTCVCRAAANCPALGDIVI